MNTCFIEIKCNELNEINGGSMAGWGTVVAGAGVTLGVIAVIATAPAGAALGVAFLASKAATAIGISDFIRNATEYYDIKFSDCIFYYA